MAAYLDTSVLASLFVVDAHSAQASAWLRRRGGAIAFSDWTLTEFTSAIAAVNRAGRLPAPMLATAEQGVDRWVARRGAALAVAPEDVRLARTMMQSTGEPLRAGDALHLAIIRRTGCSLATFDNAMRRAAADL
ncbi:MAG TPA: type II toxin-antitoxin system VapC family toxin, partial [Caulobacteraceae bacterium]|nr:type II toxin-antitoxin system VapC family toxin [Caulobacteraceae bacterium]